MSSMTSGTSRSPTPSCNRIVRRMVSLPRSLAGGFSRAMNHGIDLMGMGSRRNPNPNSPHGTFPLPSPSAPLIVQEEDDAEEWTFLASFEQHYGTSHPFFYACRFVQVLKIARDEHRFVFLYLHSPQHPFTPSFCRDTLCSELVVQFLDANFVSWGALADRGEGFQMGTTLQPASFPFCAVVAPASGDNIAVLQQIEGPVSPAELVEILQRTMEEQGMAFGSPRAKEEQKRRENQQLREEQDAAYLAAPKIDQERERGKKLPWEERGQKPVEAPNKVNYEKHKQIPIAEKSGKMKESTTSVREAQSKNVASRGTDDARITQVLIRFPNGERREQSFQSRDKVEAIYRYIDSLGLPGIGNYRLISSFPRKVYGVDQRGMTLKDAGLHPKATLFIEQIS